MLPIQRRAISDNYQIGSAIVSHFAEIKKRKSVEYMINGVVYPPPQNNFLVNRIKNIEGPQTRIDSQGKWCSVKRERQPESISCPESVQERLNNLEDHIGMNKSKL